MPSCTQLRCFPQAGMHRGKLGTGPSKGALSQASVSPLLQDSNSLLGICYLKRSQLHKNLSSPQSPSLGPLTPLKQLLMANK